MRQESGLEVPSFSFRDGLVSGSLYTSGGGGVVGPDSMIPLEFFSFFPCLAILKELFNSFTSNLRDQSPVRYFRLVFYWLWGRGGGADVDRLDWIFLFLFFS